MVLPLLPIIAGGALLGGGAGLGWGLGKKGVTKTTTYAPTITEAAPYQTYAPQVQFAPVSSYAYQGATTIISSPEAQITKKQAMEVKSAPKQLGTWDIPTTIAPKVTGAAAGAGGISTPVIAIAAVAVVAALYLGKKK
jgi:hypothetical protein